MVKAVRHYFVQAGYDWAINGDKICPTAFHLDPSDGTYPLDLNATFLYNNQVHCFLRTEDAIAPHRLPVPVPEQSRC